MIDKLHYITQQTPEFSHIDAARNAMEAGCKWIQLRVKNTPEAEVLGIAVVVKQLCDAYNAKLIINDYPEIAVEVQAYGLHLGLTDRSIAEARKITGTKCIIGGTANTYEHVLQRIHEGVDYVGLGPYCFTNTKTKLSPVLGADGIKEIMDTLRNQEIQIPVIAIGGITENDISVLIETGVYGVAISGAISFAVNSKQVVQNIYTILDKETAQH